jgi:Diacylglycerol kinase catalytic domain
MTHPIPAPSPPQRPVLAVITNGGSTQNRKHANWIDDLVANEPGVSQIRASGPADIDAALNQAATRGAEVIVVNGGDGTADLVFGGLLNQKPFAAQPAVALLSAGKTNMTAAAWSFGGDKVAALHSILAARRAGTLMTHITHRPILTIDTGHGRPALRGAFLGAADVVGGIQFCREHIYPMNLPNPISHTLAIGMLLWRGLFARADAASLDARWDAGAGGESGPFFFVSATTLDTLIVGLSPQPDTGQGPLHYLSLRGGAAALLAVMPKLMTKKIGGGTGRVVRRARSITLAFDGAYTLDGELFEAVRTQPLTISADQTLPFIRIGSS